MCLSPQQEKAIEDYKSQMGMDLRIGQALAELPGSRLTPKEGEAQSRAFLNPVLLDVTREFCPGRTR